MLAACTRTRSITEEITDDMLVTRKTRSITEEISDDLLRGCLVPGESEAGSPTPLSPTSSGGTWGPTPPPTPSSSKDLVWTASEPDGAASVEETASPGKRRTSLQKFLQKYL